jgi:tRNA threonylcarbamoyladenosine biosynthesis protein TsaE
MDFKFVSKDINDTLTIAENIESEKFPNMVICLEGDLGSGKTVFAKSFALALGITDNITSPTFNIIKEYDHGEMKLFHMDVYRLSDIKQDLGIPEYFNKKGVCIIEWADLIPDILPKNRLDIKIKIIDEDTRQFIITPHGSKYEDLCERVL